MLPPEANAEYYRQKTEAMKRAKQAKAKVNREATKEERRTLWKEFEQAKKEEFESWKETNKVFDFVDMNKNPVKNFVTGRWVLTVKRDKDGNFQKCKARLILRGFQDRQKGDLQTDSPTSTRPGFRLQC